MHYENKKVKRASFFMLSLGVFLILLSLMDLQNSMTDKNFKETKGKIIQFEHLKKGPKQLNEEIALLYEYDVNGQKFRNSKFSNGVGDIDSFEKYYFTNELIPVYYNPKNNNDSVLVTGGRYLKVDVLIIIGGLLLIWGIIGLVSEKNETLRKIWSSMVG